MGYDILCQSSGLNLLWISITGMTDLAQQVHIFFPPPHILFLKQQTVNQTQLVGIHIFKKILLIMKKNIHKGEKKQNQILFTNFNDNIANITKVKTKCYQRNLSAKPCSSLDISSISDMQNLQSMSSQLQIINHDSRQVTAEGT